jgi:hypothetical protein
MEAKRYSGAPNVSEIIILKRGFEEAGTGSRISVE